MHYAEAGLLDHNCNFVHMNVVRDDEVAAVVQSGMSITWCPTASMLQGVGGTFRGRHVELYEQGVNVALGSDAVVTTPLPAPPCASACAAFAPTAAPVCW